MAGNPGRTEAYDSGMLDVGDGNRVYWAVHGNPAGTPALYVHGGPGSGSGDAVPPFLDLRRYRVVMLDQRGCGRSTPHASDPATDMRHNTTDRLTADMERLRTHLGIDRWLLYGGSWGSTLILAYAQRHPDRVSAVVVAGVTTTRRAEIDWLYRGVARFFPAQWERFRQGAALSGRPAEAADDRLAGGLVADYARLMEQPDLAVRAQAAAEWCAWEDAVLSLEPSGRATPYSDRIGPARLAFVRICTHYFAHAAWLDEGELIAGAHRLAGIPALLAHGRLDLSSPLDTAWELARNWPGARLEIVDDVGHKGGPAMARLLSDALDGFADAR